MPHRLSLFWYYRSMIIEGLRWLQLATRSPAATPFDRWIAHLSMAGQLDDPALRMFATTTELMDATAVIAMNDRLAFGAYQAIWERGLRIPVDLSIASFDDDVIATYVHPGLTTVRIPYEEMGREAMAMLLSGRPEGHIQVPMPLRERESVADLRR